MRDRVEAYEENSRKAQKIRIFLWMLNLEVGTKNSLAQLFYRTWYEYGLGYFKIMRHNSQDTRYQR